MQSGIMRALRKWSSISRVLVFADKQYYLCSKAAESQRAAHNNDMRTCYSIARSLSGFTVRQDKSVLKTNGERTSSEQERQLRWQEHFSSVFGGSVVPRCDLVPVLSESQVQEDGGIDVSPSAIEAAVAKLGKNKGGRSRLCAL